MTVTGFHRNCYNIALPDQTSTEDIIDLEVSLLWIMRPLYWGSDLSIMLVQVNKHMVIARNHPGRFSILAISLLTMAKYYHCGWILLSNPENYGDSLVLTTYQLFAAWTVSSRIWRMCACVHCNLRIQLIIHFSTTMIIIRDDA